MKKFLLYVAIILLLTAGMAAAADESLLEIGADYQWKYDILRGTVHDYVSKDPGNPAIPSYQPYNNSLMLDRLGLNLKANVAENLTVKARPMFFKCWGHQTMQPVQGSFAADREVGPFDGTISNVPSDSLMRIDNAYATFSNIGGAPLWFTVGRRPSVGGIPNNLRQDLEKIGPEGDLGIMSNYAFDGATVGYSLKSDAMPGAYAKLSYGKGFDSGFNDTTTNTLKDTDYIGFNVVPYDTNDLEVNLQVQKGFHITDTVADTAFAPNTNQQPVNPDVPAVKPTANVGNITWWGGVIMGKVSDFNLFASVAQSKADPDELNANGEGLLWDSNHDKASRTGTAFFVGGRYDIKSTGTKIGLEYNQGSKYWIGLVPAADDLWTSKLGTRGKVYEVYLIQEFHYKPLMKKAQTFIKVGYQSYKFDYTGSNNWMGAPVKISNLNLTNTAIAQNLAPLEVATDLYFTMELIF